MKQRPYLPHYRPLSSNASYNEKVHKSIDVLMQEYNTLRIEALKCIDKQYQIVILELTGLGAMFSFKEKLSDMFWTIVPLFLIALTSLWLSEQRRMIRAGDHIALIEKKVNKLMERIDGEEQHLLDWEQSLRARSPGSINFIKGRTQQLLSCVGVYVPFAYGLLSTMSEHWTRSFPRFNHGFIEAISLVLYAVAFISFTLVIWYVPIHRTIWYKKEVNPIEPGK